ncbi:DegT/DnrJ/EryC1/StrS family aminotransferase [Microcoleus sp. FACHB-1515]|uniref:aminotransferase class I/II-fold pyridoxal phosphate-dependent enzyme n=1 Tax=Leptolyngbya sp. FACHB-1515 TaxID=2933931 RepID=UPI001683132D|nr:DegT/DnrJ/EryC1/StrS family aminotransferase [Microcoleus sp. FACHB-1515]
MWCDDVNSIPPLDLVGQFQSIADEVNAAVMAVLASAQYINGPIVQNFEQQFAQYIGTAECVSCNSGTDALFLALRALGIKAGDEVITTPFSFFATAEVITAAGATPIFVDIEPETFNLDLSLIEAAITPRTKAIVPVHLFGQPVDMARLMAIARSHNLYVVEDCAQAVGAEWNGQRVGSIGHIGCYSFYPTKNLGACGDGGAVTTSDPQLARKIRSLRTHGERERYIHEDIGLTSRLDAVQAAILQIKLRYLDQWNAQRQRLADRYTELFDRIPGIIAPRPIPGGKTVWHQYTIRLQNRDAVRSQLQQQGVNTMLYYPIPLHRQPVYEKNYAEVKLPIAEQMAREVLSLPMFPELSIEQQDQVVYALKDCLIEAASS